MLENFVFRAIRGVIFKRLYQFTKSMRIETRMLSQSVCKHM